VGKNEILIIQDDPGLRIQLQRRRANTPLWRTLTGGWLDAGTLEFVDRDIVAGAAYEYRVRGMDRAGNRASNSDWSDFLPVQIPDQE
jgi:hypothetical protein